MRSTVNTTPLLLLFGLLTLGIAGVSIVDMFRPRPWDGIVLQPGASSLVVREVVPGSGAALAGIAPGDEIIGVARELIRSTRDVGRVLGRRRIGETVPYLIVRADGSRKETQVRLGRWQIGGGSYLYGCVVGLSFFFVGLFVLLRQPGLRASRVFFLVCGLLLLLLVCRLRPASYAGVDSLILQLGTFASLVLPAAFLHFYLVFPRPSWLAEQAARTSWPPWLLRLGWPLLYAVPLLVYFGTRLIERVSGLTGGALAGLPMASWWLLAAYVLLGFAALVANARRLGGDRERRGARWVLLGSIFGLVPFLTALATGQDSQRIFWFGVLPLALVPATFTYAIVRFQLLDIRVILRRSLLYTSTTLVVTGLYAFAIALFSAMFRQSHAAVERAYPFILAFAIVLLFEPLRRRIQKPIDRYFFAQRSRLRHALVELGEALTAQLDPQAVVQELVEALPRLAGLRFAALYQLRGGRLARVAGPDSLPESLPLLPEVQDILQQHQRLVQLDRLDEHEISDRARDQIGELGELGVEAIGDLASSRRWIGLMLISRKEGQIPFDREELSLLRGLLNQASLALETGLLLEERTHQAELQRELQIAARIQADLHPGRLRFGAGWEVAAMVRPARDVGGDFIAQLPAETGHDVAVIFGDVSGKSVSGALMMMAAHEILHALALADPHPSRLFDLADRRLYRLGDRRFVGLGYLAPTADSARIRYVIAGQPPLLVRRVGGTVEELPLPDHRIPLGALGLGGYDLLEAPVGHGDLVLGISDGVTDATAASGETFGDERLQTVLLEAPRDAAGVVEHILRAIDDFTAGGTQYDDVTVVAIRRLEAGSRPEDARS